MQIDEFQAEVAPVKNNDVKKAVIWYGLGSLAAGYLIISGGSRGSLVGIMLGALFFAWLIPLPHALIAILLKRKRNWQSTLRIYRGWHKGLVILCVIGLVAQIANNSLLH